MKINFNQEILKDDGTSIIKETKSFSVVKNEAGEWVSEPTVDFKEKTVLADICSDVLASVVVKVSVADTMQRFHLRNQIVKGGEIDLTKEELDIIKDLINNKYDLMMAGKVLVMLGEK